MSQKTQAMNIHIGNLVRKVAYDKRMKMGEFAQKVGVHIGSVSRIMGYPEINTAMLKRLCVAMEYDFFKHYSDELKLPSAEKEKTSCEKLLEESQKENERLKQELAYLKEINELLKKGR